jgi:hypothetical protein
MARRLLKLPTCAYCGNERTCFTYYLPKRPEFEADNFKVPSCRICVAHKAGKRFASFEDQIRFLQSKSFKRLKIGVLGVTMPLVLEAFERFKFNKKKLVAGDIVGLPLLDDL